MKQFLEAEARDDFNRARKQAFFGEVFGLFAPDRQELLSLQEVREFLRPRGETYRGMQAVPLERILGSEGRYRDFNKQFLPRHEYLRNRWQRVDMAHLSDVILPPIKLYEVGGVYFVRDGNHRVSVARAQGVREIDAEVITLETEIPMHQTMTRENLQRAVIEHEHQKFRTLMKIDRILPEAEFIVSVPGRYDELIQHVYGHKFFLNERETVEMPLEKALRSWYKNVYLPILGTIQKNRLMSRFPGRTSTDMYLWIVKHWHLLKEQYGEDFPIQVAATDYSQRFGVGWFRRLLKSIRQR